MSEKKYFRCKDVMQLLEVSEGKAYAIMRALNKELNQKGFLTVSGRVPRKYFEERFNIAN
jgi:hypothetical protein